MKKADIDSIRERLRKRKGSSRDVNEFRIPNVAVGETKKFRVFVLPPIVKGDTIAGGEKAPADFPEGFVFYEHGYHWIDGQAYQCPRCHDHQRCALCSLGFELMRKTDDPKDRRQISRSYLASSKYAVNIYFLDDPKNPEELRGKVMWWSAPKTVFDKMEACIYNTDAGEDDDPQAYGAFWDVESGHILLINVGEQGGFNDYKQSKLLAKRMPIPAEEDKVQGILNSRHWVPGKFNDRDQDVMQKLVNKVLSSDTGFDDDENTKRKPKDPPKEEPKEEPKDETPKETPKTEATVPDDGDEEDLDALLAQIRKKDKN